MAWTHPFMSSRSRIQRHWVIGDVHGCADALQDLLMRLPRSDHLILCGDVINRGPRIPAALKLVWSLVRRGRATWLMGNHERALVNALRLGGWQTAAELAGCDTYRQLGDRRCRQWLPRLSALPLAFWGRGWVATHAGLDPLSWQPDLTIRTPFWEAYDGRFGEVIVGHTPAPGVRRLGRHIVQIDTGACYGGLLSAYCPETGDVEQVPGLTGTRVSALPHQASISATLAPSLAGLVAAAPR
jgi:serine/threonine protein phosphatase 1